jgi:hypothetical protein
MTQSSTRTVEEWRGATLLLIESAPAKIVFRFVSMIDNSIPGVLHHRVAVPAGLGLGGEHADVRSRAASAS